MTISVPNWENLQHYKDRDPTWIKLYRKLLHKREWRQLSPEAAKYLVDIWMLASRYQGDIKLSQEAIAWEIRESPDDVRRWTQELEAQGFIKMLATCYQDAIPEKRREEKRREKGTQEKSDISDSEIGDSFARLWSTNPRGPMVTAEREYWRAVDAGAEPIVIARRWQAYCARQAANEWTVGNLDRWLTKGGHMDASLDDVASYRANGSPPLERLTAD